MWSCKAKERKSEQKGEAGGEVAQGRPPAVKKRLTGCLMTAMFSCRSSRACFVCEDDMLMVCNCKKEQSQLAPLPFALRSSPPPHTHLSNFLWVCGPESVRQRAKDNEVSTASPVLVVEGPVS